MTGSSPASAAPLHGNPERALMKGEYAVIVV
jgi:hypothetical protein